MEYLEKSQPRLKVVEKPKTEASQKPWPRSVLLSGYALAGTVIPYTLMWIGLTNESTRSWILNNCSETVEQKLREHFGEPDFSQISYVDRNEDDGTTTPIPYILRGELPQTTRLQERRIDESLDQPLKARVKLRDSKSDTILGECQLELPAAAKASKAELVPRVVSAASCSIDKSSLESGTITVDFPVEKTQTINSDAELLFQYKEETESSAAVDPLRVEGRVYSLWHYQPAAPEISNNSGKNGMQMSQDEIEVARLQHRIAILEEELKNSTVATRPIDDITDELASSKAKLRQLQWKRWLPWR
jgi:hypothetical protein